MSFAFRPLATALSLAVFATGALAADDKPAVTNAPVADSLIVKAKGFEIKRSQLDQAWEDFKKEASGGGQEITPADQIKFAPKLLNHLILIQLLQARATDTDKAKGKAEAELRLAELKKQFHGEEMFATMLKSAGMTPESLRTQLISEGVSHAVLRGMVSVSDDQVKKFYDENPDKFSEAEKVRASHILVGTKNSKTGDDLSADEKKAKLTVAEGLLKRARAGEDFAKLAKEFSDDPGSKDNGGEYKFGRGEMMPEFEKAAFGLKTNEVSEIVTTTFGYHIIKLSERFPAVHTEFAKVSTEIKDELQDQEIEKQFTKLYAQLRQDGGVEIVDEKLKAADAAEAAEAEKAAKAEAAAKDAPIPAAPKDAPKPKP